MNFIEHIILLLLLLFRRARNGAQVLTCVRQVLYNQVVLSTLECFIIYNKTHPFNNLTNT